MATKGSESPFFLDVPRTIEPAKATHPALALIVVTTNTVLLERNGRLLQRRDERPRRELAELIHNEPPSLWVADHALALLGEMCEVMKRNSRWQFRLSSVEREMWTALSISGNGRIFEMLDVVSYFGLNRTGRARSHFHYIIDPVTFSGRTADELVTTPGTKARALMEWAKPIRALARDKGIRVTPTKGGFAAQFLRHPRIYPEPRRSIPRFTNEQTRQALPGNHYDYKLGFDVVVDEAICIDQENAHHRAAINLEFPDSNSLFAWGNSLELDRPGKAWGYRSHRKAVRQQLWRPGLFYGRLEFPPHLQKQIAFLPPWARQQETTTFIYSNELPMLHALGGQLTHLIAAWTSENTESEGGIATYAQWALDYLNDFPQDKAIVKPVLLSLYGILGARPGELKFSYGQSKSAKVNERVIKTGGAWAITCKDTRSRRYPRKLANVIQRGMIEAETRKRSIEKANELTSIGIEVYGIHADALYISTDKELPLLESPWRNKFGTLRGHSFPYAGAIRNSKERKYPGIGKDQQEKRDQLDRIERRQTA